MTSSLANRVLGSKATANVWECELKDRDVVAEQLRSFLG